MKYKEVTSVSVSLDSALEICERAVTDLGWKITGQNETRLRAKQGNGFTSGVYFVICEVDYKAADETTLYIQSEVMGFNPIVSGRLKNQVNQVRSRVELLARRAAPSKNQPGPSNIAESVARPIPLAANPSINLAELEQYADLHDQSVLSDDEFLALKRQWLQALEA